MSSILRLRRPHPIRLTGLESRAAVSSGNNVGTENGEESIGVAPRGYVLVSHDRSRRVCLPCWPGGSED
jgi:hypothetical protein